MIDIKVTGLDELHAKFKRILPNSRTRIQSGALRQAGDAIAEEANRRVHSPRGHARTFKVFVHPNKAYVSPGSRAAFFSQRYRPILAQTVNATHSRVENVMREAVEAGVRSSL